MNTINSIIYRLSFLSFVLLVHAIGCHAQSCDMNYIQTKIFLDEQGSTFLRHIDYYDELGVVEETVDVGGNTTNTPIVSRTWYNVMLKPYKQWAPVPSSSGINYLDSRTVDDLAESTYNDCYAYGTNLYDDFQELTTIFKSGSAWTEPITITRQVVHGDEVKRYSIDASGKLREKGMYPYGLLTSTTTTDEDGRSITVYTNVHGNTVLERRGDDNDTYYVYDDYGRLSYVLPPMCQDCDDLAVMEKYWYSYKYDNRGRCIEKQLPGCEPIKYWYDEANRIQSEQDGHLREQSLYRNYSYDGIGRLVLQTISETRGEAIEDDAEVVEIKNFYDDYSCLQELTELFPEWAGYITASGISPMITRGKPTATLCSTSNGNKYFEMYRYDAKGRINYKLSAYGDQWMKTVQTRYKFVGDVLETRENVYTYKDGKVSELAKRKINNSYYSGTRLLKKVQVTHHDQNGKTNSQNISQLTYDVFGNVTANNRPGTAADITYEYDTLHGWLKGISSPSGFSEQLLRETATNEQQSGNIGSIEWKNTSNGEVHKYDYIYDDLGRLTNSQYSSSANDTKDCYNEKVEYNRNGSITSLLRRGMMNNGTFGLIDNLTINYDGNQLQNVMDDAEPVNYNGALDFNDGDNSEVEYEYDSNGALKRDSNRGIDIISYDYGHHPNDVSMGMRHIRYDYTPDGRKLSTSHATTISKRITNVTTDTYIDGLILRDGKPLMWQFDGGYVALNENGTPTSWNYYVTDHLGSTRKVVDSNNNVLETINYYPFGSEMRMSNPYQIIRKNSKMNLETAGFTMPADSAISIKNPGIMIPKDSMRMKESGLLAEDYWQPYRFSGKELDKQNGLNMYDFGARLFDVAGVPMWTSVDPLAEKHYPFTPYSYCIGDPVNKFDPDGKDVWDKLQGYGRGFLSNIIPGTNLRDSYTPNNSADYNAGLKSADRTSIVIGSALIADGGRNVAAGIGGASASAAVTAVSGGAAAPVTVVTGGGSLVLSAVGAAEGGMGAMMLYNTSKNSSEGYNRGSKLSPNQANKAINRGKAPKGIKRVDKAHQPGGQRHVHLENGRGAINADGSGHDGPKPKLTKKETDFISMIEGFFK